MSNQADMLERVNLWEESLKGNFKVQDPTLKLVDIKREYRSHFYQATYDDLLLKDHPIIVLALTVEECYKAAKKLQQGTQKESKGTHMKQYTYRVTAVFYSVIEDESEELAHDRAIEEVDFGTGDQWCAELESVEDLPGEDYEDEEPAEEE